MDKFVTFASWLMLCYSILGSIDALYIHLWKLRLFAHPETRREHILHTSAILPIMISGFLLLGANFGGILLWIGAGFSLTALTIQVIDMVEEGESRRIFGGLGSSEYILHAVLVGLKFTYTTLIFISKPSEAWNINAPIILAAPYPEFVTEMAINSLVGPVLVFVLHIVLLHPRFLNRIDTRTGVS
ncbi:MAG TPA: hypothetical protein VE954_29335 [Oligoflexus sp.]|uniref:hypothetical protein n=1 Tax=Oligoflexus sp. TaxID=1971216 RepID=UPI002D26ADEA|nr:hypothetical protein [Oligoflexus sp.]HYX37227.1 hypothetical protein [Oligoflexus sp.]